MEFWSMIIADLLQLTLTIRSYAHLPSKGRTGSKRGMRVKCVYQTQCKYPGLSSNSNHTLAHHVPAAIQTALKSWQRRIHEAKYCHGKPLSNISARLKYPRYLICALLTLFERTACRHKCGKRLSSAVFLDLKCIGLYRQFYQGSSHSALSRNL